MTKNKDKYLLVVSFLEGKLLSFKETTRNITIKID